MCKCTVCCHDVQDSRKWQMAAKLVKDDAPVAVPDDSDNVVGGGKTKSKSKKKEEYTTAGKQDMTDSTCMCTCGVSCSGRSLYLHRCFVPLPLPPYLHPSKIITKGVNFTGESTVLYVYMYMYVWAPYVSPDYISMCK